MTWSRRADVCYNLDTDTYSKCRTMSFVSLTIERENKSESKFKKTVKNLVLSSHSYIKYDECTSWFQNS